MCLSWGLVINLFRCALFSPDCELVGGSADGGVGGWEVVNKCLVSDVFCGIQVSHQRQRFDLSTIHALA